MGGRGTRPGPQVPAGAKPGARPLSAPAALPWAQAGVTDDAAARAFLSALAAADTLVLSTSDGDVGHVLTAGTQRFRGHGVTVAANLLAATPPPPELVAHHRSFGLGPGRIFCPRAPSAGGTLAANVLADTDLLARLRADGSLARMLVSFKDPSAARLIEVLGLTPVHCAPEPAAYEHANDKLELARSGPRYGFATLPAEPVADESALTAAFPALAAIYGAGCILRKSRGTSGRWVHRAGTLRQARRAWRRLAADGGEILLLPYVPATAIRRNVAIHGLVRADGVAPFLFTDQIIRHHDFRGGRAVDPWAPADIAAIRHELAGVARWFRALGYTGAPAGIDGFLLDEAHGGGFVVLDSNARLSATMGPWSAVEVLAAGAGRPLVWQLEGFRLVGVPLTLERVRRRLGSDLLAPAAIERGGVLPTWLSTRPLGPAAVSTVWAILLGHDADHVAHLRRRVRRLGLVTR